MQLLRNRSSTLPSGLTVATVISQRVHRDLAPKPLMSIMYEGCMEKGKDVSAGGAMYNFGPGVVWSGLATYADCHGSHQEAGIR